MITSILYIFYSNSTQRPTKVSNSLTHASVHRGLLQHRLLPYMAPVGLGPPPELANFLVKGDPKASIKRVESWSFYQTYGMLFFSWKIYRQPSESSNWCQFFIPKVRQDPGCFVFENFCKYILQPKMDGFVHLSPSNIW